MLGSHHYCLKGGGDGPDEVCSGLVERWSWLVTARLARDQRGGRRSNSSVCSASRHEVVKLLADHAITQEQVDEPVRAYGYKSVYADRRDTVGVAHSHAWLVCVSHQCVWRPAPAACVTGEERGVKAGPALGQAWAA